MIKEYDKNYFPYQGTKADKNIQIHPNLDLHYILIVKELLLLKFRY
jgi:hypothetical protein